MNNDSLKQHLSELIALLDAFNIDNWCRYFTEAMQKIDTNPVVTANNVLCAYGGMGSFNDCILSYNPAKTPEGFSISKQRIAFNQFKDTVYSEAILMIHQHHNAQTR